MLTHNECVPVGFRVTHQNGKTELVETLPIKSSSHKAVESLHLRVERKGFTDKELIEMAGAQDATPEMQDYIVSVQRNVMYRLQRVNTFDAYMKRPEIPAILKEANRVENAA